MNEMLTLALAWMGGAVLGALFFGGLWWTIRRGITSGHPALLFLGSLLLRTSLVLVGFYFVSGCRWERLVLCLLGFVMARLIMTWLIRPQAGIQASHTQEASHAP